MIKVKATEFTPMDQKFDIISDYHFSKVVMEYLQALIRRIMYDFYGEVCDFQNARTIEYRVNSKIQNDIDTGKIRCIGNTWVETEILWVDL